MADLATDDPRAAAWERRMLAPVIVAAVGVLPLLALHLTHPHGALAAVETAGHWLIWLVFMAEVVLMLAVVEDRRAWIDGHRFELLVVAVSSPLVPLALAVAPAVRLLIVVKAFKMLKLAKVIKLAKLGKSVKLLRSKLELRGTASFALGVLALALAAATVFYMTSGDAPLKGDGQTVTFVIAGMLATFGVNHLRRRHNAATR